MKNYEYQLRNHCFKKIIEKIASYQEKEIVPIKNIIISDKCICETADIKFNCEQCIISMLSFMRLFGVIEFVSKENMEGFKIKSLTSKYFLLSIKEYLDNNLSIFSQWEELKGKIPQTNESNIFYGPQFLHLLEKRRIELNKDSEPIRYGEVARIVIKTKKNGKDVFLFQYDSKVLQYKIIGGKRELIDKTPEHTIRREILEELPLSNLKFEKNYKIRKFYEKKERVVSYVYGAYSEYLLHFYYAYDLDYKSLRLGNSDRWITLDEIKSGKTDDDYDIYPMKEEMVDEFYNIPYSFIYEEKKEFISKIFKVISKRKWEIVGLLVGIVSLIIGVISK